jgi:hypothetical protein
MMRPAETVPAGLAVIEGELMAKLRESGVEEIGKTILRGSFPLERCRRW